MELADIQLSVLVRCLPKHIQQHVQLQLKEDSTCNDVRNAVLGYENVTQNRRRRSSRSLEWCRATELQVEGLHPWRLMWWLGKEKGSSKAKAKTTRRASPRAKDNGVVALVKERVTRATRRGDNGKGKGDWNKVVLVVFKATVTIVISLATRRKIATS